MTKRKTKSVIVNNRDTLRWLVNYLATAEVIAYDLETYTVPAEKPFKRTNFQEWHSGDSLIVSISFSWRIGLGACVPLWHPQSKWSNPQAVLNVLSRYLRRPACVYVGHNVKYDAKWLAAKGVTAGQDFDTMLAAHMLDENRPKGLKALAETVLGVSAYDLGEELKNAQEVPLRKLCLYNNKDTDYTLRFYNRFAPALAKQERSNLIFEKLTMPASVALTEIERTGVYLDPVRWQERHDKALENRDKINAYVQKKVPQHLQPLNIQSPQQMGRFLFEHMGLPVLQETPTGAPSTNASVLKRLSSHSKVALALIKYRKWAKYLNTYLLPWWYEHRDTAGRIHSVFDLSGTVTGRLSGKGGIQQTPRDNFIRSVIGATPGWTFVSADYSQIELRIAAMVANEKVMLRQFAQGLDIHTIRAAAITSKTQADVTKDERFKAKAVNFGFIYGMSAGSFVNYCYDEYDLEITEDESEAMRNRFFSDYPGLQVWHKRQRRLVNRYQRVTSPLGRIRRLPDVASEDRGVAAYAERQAINSPVQSFASDIMLIALVRLHSMLPPDKARLIATVHDSLLAEIRNRYVSRYCHLLKETMEDMSYLAAVFGVDVTVPIIAEVETGTHWGELELWTP